MSGGNGSGGGPALHLRGLGLIGKLSGRALAMLSKAALNFIRDEGFDRSAAISYYALFGFMPFLAIVGLIGGWLLGSEDRLLNDMISAVKEVLPAVAPMTATHARQFLPGQGVLLVLMVPVFLWTASYASSSVEGSINHILRAREERHYLVGRLKSIALLGVAGVALLLIPAIQQVGVTIRRLSPDIEPLMPLQTFFSEGAILIAGFLAFSFALLYIPAVRMPMTPAFTIAAAAAAAWQIARVVLFWGLTTSSESTLLSGSFSFVIGLLLWVYITSVILLYAVELLALACGRR